MYGAVRRDQGFLDDVRSAYRRSEIAFVDGSDVVGGNPADKFGVEGLERTGVLFRREIETPWSPARPVHFGIPACKALAEVPHKVRVAAQYRPKTSDAFARRSYAFKDEQSYYRMYADARFAVTCRRAGWDCLRHYEILANRCVPVFDVDDMPAWTEAACTWADLLLAEGKTDMAVDILLKTLERTRGKPPPDNHITRRELWDASFYDKLGLALWRAGRRDEARVTYRIAVLKYPDNEFLKRQLAACGESGPDRLARLLAASYPETKKGGPNGMEQKDAHA